MTASPIRLFCSYAEEDESFRTDLVKHLSLLKREGLLTAWHFRMITAGQEWKGEIDSHINNSQIILLLISADFISSDYCYDVEMKRATQLHDTKVARVIPVILRPVDWQTAPFAKLQALPTGGKPITKWENRDEAFLDVAQGIRHACQSLLVLKTTDIQTPSIGHKTIPSPERRTTNVYCTRCGVKAGSTSYCNNIYGHDFQSFTGDVYCTRCGVKAGSSSYCNNIYGHDFQSFTK